jgi:hypothetical protein
LEIITWTGEETDSRPLVVPDDEPMEDETEIAA